jgi:hypothetical protein
MKIFNYLWGCLKMKKYLVFILAFLLAVPLLVQPAFSLDTTAAVNNVAPISAMNFGASGSNQTTTGSIAANGNQLTLASSIDFENGQGIVVANAGPAPKISAPKTLIVTPTISAPNGLTVAASGTAGSTSYSYTVIAVDTNGGYSAAPKATSISSGNAALSSTNYNVVSLTNPFPGAVKYEWYRTASGGAPSSVGYIGETANLALNDPGLPVIAPPAGIPSSPPAAAVGATSYTYAVAAMDADGAITASATASTSSGWAVLSNMTYNNLVVGSVAGVEQYVWYRTASSGAPSGTGFIAASNGGFYEDWGWVSGNPPYSIPDNTPDRPVNGPLITTITSGGGTTSLTLKANAGSTASSTLIQHDDSLALQNAFNQGGSIDFPAGTYNVFKSLVINNSNTEISGAGIDQTIVSNMITVPSNYYNYGYATAPYTIGTINTSEITGVIIHDLTFNGNYYADNSYDGVALSNVDNSSIYNVKSINTAGNCLLVTSMRFTSYGGDWPHYDYPGLKSIKNCIADNDSGEVFASFYDSNVLIMGNTASRLFLFNVGGGKGAWLQTLDVEGAMNDTVSNNAIRDIPDSPSGFQNGGDLAVDAVYSINTNISNNTFVEQNNTYHGSTISFDTGGIYEENSTDVNLVVSGNHFINTGGIIAHIDNGYASANGVPRHNGWASNIQVTDNIVENGSLIVYISNGATASHINISNNTIDITSPDNSGGAIAVDSYGGNTASDDVSILDNTINAKGFTNQGSNSPIALDLGNLKDVTVTGNKISSPNYIGIDLQKVSNFDASSNMVDYKNSSDPFLSLGIDVDSCSNGKVSNNDVHNDTSYACKVINPNSITISDNKFNNNQGSIDISGGYGSNLSIINNDFSNCTDTYPVDSNVTNEAISGNIGYTS